MWDLLYLVVSSCNSITYLDYVHVLAKNNGLGTDSCQHLFCYYSVNFKQYFGMAANKHSLAVNFGVFQPNHSPANSWPCLTSITACHVLPQCMLNKNMALQ